MSPEQALTFHCHSAKRFNINCMAASSEFTSLDQCQIGRFSGSTAQTPNLEPIDAMLQAHTLSCSVLPSIYAGKANVRMALDLVVQLDAALRRAADLILSRPELADVMGGWGSDGALALSAVARVPPPTAPLPLLLS